MIRNNFLVFLITLYISITIFCLWPNKIAYYDNFFLSDLRSFLLLLIFILAFIYAPPIKINYEVIKVFFPMLLIAVFYSYINKEFSALIPRAILFLLLANFFIKYSFSINFAWRIYLSFCFILSIILIIKLLLNLSGSQIVYHIATSSYDASKYFEVNFIFGSPTNIKYYRESWHFTEANKLGYFLIPAVVWLFYNLRTKNTYLIMFITTSFILVLTFSLFTFIALFSIFIFNILLNGERVIPQLIKIAPKIFLLIIPILIIKANDIEQFYRLLDKSTSFNDRYTGIISSIAHFKENIFGTAVSDYYSANNLIEGNSTNAFVWWAKFGGIQSLIFLFYFLIKIYRQILFLHKNANIADKSISLGILAFILVQTFYGNYYEYFFIFLISILSALYIKIKYE